MAASEIILELNDVDQLLVSRNSVFYGKRMLNPDAEELIIEEAGMASRKDHIHLRIHFRKNEIHSKDDISDAIRQHFNYRRKKISTATKEDAESWMAESFDFHCILWSPCFPDNRYHKTISGRDRVPYGPGITYY